ncbi:hypothetical protein [Marinobacter sp.]|uniref:hypothetical protein n=1 Tax=Marinobacter sp. TaxID=50741 RepID=UPI0034A370EA
MSDELQALRQEIADLRQQLSETDDFASGVHQVLMNVLPFLLRDHPNVEKVQGLLKSAADQYEGLLQNPEKDSSGEPDAGVYEPSKMLYQHLALLGIWPGVDPREAARSTVERR